ncbi:hypothetical protein [Cyanobium sp. CH-040]|uniref:hypothetical protein n=1 Tax=Cyanobium sp. CH-040 TaxID=2823708 RepID=UPI0020CBE141|nr:hypothetical protein [Cyanobium sp. CH-040]MCP9926662.1 hypothetical protein [Cyanobium sp. CH-040]
MPSVEVRAGGQGWPARLGRVQRGERLQLRLGNLYILPTVFGVLWLGGALLLQVVGIQTQRNGPLLLSFLMLTLQLLALHLTHFNLQGLELRCGRSEPGFAGEALTYPLLACSRHPRNAIRLRLTGQPLDSQAAQLRRIPAGTSSLELDWRCDRRGLQTPGVLLVSSTAPLGLFVCWSRWAPAARQTVYPARQHGPVARTATAGSALDAAMASGGREGSEHWHDLRPHRPQESQARLAWKALAQGRGRLSKVFRDPAGTPPLLTPAPGVEAERALRHLAAEIWQRSRRGEAYGLVLPHLSVPAGQGRRHRDRCLLALATAPGAGTSTSTSTSTSTVVREG